MAEKHWTVFKWSPDFNLQCEFQPETDGAVCSGSGPNFLLVNADTTKVLLFHSCFKAYCRRRPTNLSAAVYLIVLLKVWVYRNLSYLHNRQTWYVYTWWNLTFSCSKFYHLLLHCGLCMLSSFCSTHWTMWKQPL